MKVLLDECVPHPLRTCLVGHDAYTAKYMGWTGVKNGQPLMMAAGAGFEAVLTTDQNLEYQQNLTSLPLAVVVLEAPSNDLADLLPLVPALPAALTSLPPRPVTHVR